MNHSLLTRPMIVDVLATACQQKEQLQQVLPGVLTLDTHGQKTFIALPDLADALTKRVQMYGIGRKFPDITEAVFIAESWIAPSLGVAPSEHPGREEAIVLVGRNRDNTNGVFAKQVFTTDGKRISWQAPDITIKPGIAEGIVDLIFAP